MLVGRWLRAFRPLILWQRALVRAQGALAEPIMHAYCLDGNTFGFVEPHAGR